MSAPARILVTGASGAIGGEIAAQAAIAGAIVGVHGRSVESTDAAMERLASRVPDGRFVALPADLRHEAAAEDMVAGFVAAAGGLDALIHCAIAGASGITGPFARTVPGSFAAHAALVLGIFERLCFAAYPHLAQAGGTIIGFTSDAGRFAAPRQAVVGGAFGGIMAFVRNLAVEAARDGVRVHCISPTFVEETPVLRAMVAAGRADAARARAGLGLPSPADIAPLALFLCGPGAAKITGQIISVNGGLSA